LNDNSTVCITLIIVTPGSFLFGGLVVKTVWRWCRCIETCGSAYDIL